MHVLVWLRTYVQEKSALRQEVVQVQLSYSLSRWRFENRKHTYLAGVSKIATPPRGILEDHVLKLGDIELQNPFFKDAI